MVNIYDIKKEFPIFSNNPSLVYLDSAATSQKPQAVLKAMDDYYRQYNANVYRGLYPLSEKATMEYEAARQTVCRFVNAQSEKEIIFTRGTTEAVNLVAYGFGRQEITEDDEIAVTIADHHSNFVPWQQLAAENGAIFKIINTDGDGNLAGPLEQIITGKTKILALPLISNVLGKIYPVREIITEAKKINPGIIAVVDAAQAAGRVRIDVRNLGADFLAFSGHKMYGPTGIGALWGKPELLEKMSPFQYGGEMIKSVRAEGTEFASLPHKFEAGTPAIAEAIGLKAAIGYIESIGIDQIESHEKELAKYCSKQLKTVIGNRLSLVSAADSLGIVAFTVKGIHSHDIAQVLGSKNICIRAGHHCAMPLHGYLGLDGTARASFGIYNGKEDIDKLVTGLKETAGMFGG